MTQPHYHYEPEHDETVVVERRRSALGAIVAVLVIAAVLLAIWFFALGPGSSGITSDNNLNVNVPSNVVASNPPASVEVNVPSIVVPSNPVPSIPPAS